MTLEDKQLAAHAGYWTERRVRLSQYYQWGVYKIARRLLKGASVPRIVVDFGCGPGTKLENMLQDVSEVRIGIDLEYAIEVARSSSSAGAKYIIGDLCEPCLRPFRADIVIVADVLEHLRDPHPLMGLISEMCQLGSTGVLSTPAKELMRGDDNAVVDKAEHVQEWTTNEFMNFVERHELDVVSQAHIAPLKFGAGSAMPYLRKRFQQLKGDRHFKYENVVVVRR